MVDVEKWQVRDVVHLLGEQLGESGAPALSVATGTLTVKARPRDDDTVNVWVDGRRSSLPPAVAATLGDHGITPGSADIVVESAPESPGDAAVVLLLVDPGVADPPDRAGECRRAAEALDADHLAGVGPDAVLRLEDESLKARTRHVITETARVRAATRAVDTGAWPQLGAILTASHESLRDDFDVTCAELDVAAEAAVEAGALGARASGGVVVALVTGDRVAAVRDRLEQRFESAGWARPHIVRQTPSWGT